MVSKVINLEEYKMSIPYENPAEYMQEMPIKKEKSMESTELNKLFEALAKAQMEMEVAKTDSTNPFWKNKYADLKSVVESSRPFLAKNGLCIIQRIIPGEKDRPYLNTRLGHLSGQWMESVILINPPTGAVKKDGSPDPQRDIQIFGSYVTYLRRYAYSSLVGVVTGDEDDDGENASYIQREQDYQSPKISRDQLNVLANELKDENELLDRIFKGYSIKKLSDLSSKSYSSCLQKIREIKMNRGGAA